MTDRITIPSEAVEAAKEAYFLAAEANRKAGTVVQDVWAAGFRAMLKAWPGMTYAKWRDYGQADRLVLPLPTENTND